MEIVVPAPTVSCVPPLLWRVNRCECPAGGLPMPQPNGELRCLPPPPVSVAPQCVASISYPAGDPNAAQITVTPGCDQAGLELAVAVALAKLLGAK